MLSLNVKRHIVDFLESRMDRMRGQSRLAGFYPAILIRDGDEFDRFKEDLWVYVSQQVFDDEKKQAILDNKQNTLTNETDNQSSAH